MSTENPDRADGEESAERVFLPVPDSSTLKSNVKSQAKEHSRERILKKRQQQRKQYLEKKNILKPSNVQKQKKSDFNFTPKLPLEDLRNQGILKRRSSLLSAKYREAKQQALHQQVDILEAVDNLAEKVTKKENENIQVWGRLPMIAQVRPTVRPVLSSATYRKLREHRRKNKEASSRSRSPSTSSSRSRSHSRSGSKMKTRPWSANKHDAKTPLFRTSLPPINNRPNEQTFRDVIFNGDTNSLQKLIHNRRDQKTLSVSELNHALLIAVNRKEVMMTEMLLMSGADVHAFKEYNPLIVQAAFINSTEIMKIILQFGGDPNIQTDPHYTPLYFACHRSNFDMVKMLVKAGADVLLPSRENLTPLMAAARAGSIKCVRYLLFHSTANINEQDSSKKTALHYAALSGKMRIVQALLKNNAKIFVPDSSSITPFIAAMLGHHGDMADMLLPEDINETIRDETSVAECTMLFYAVRYSHVPSARSLIDKGASITKATSSNRQLLAWALDNKDAGMVQLLAPRTDLSRQIDDNEDSTNDNSIQYFIHHKMRQGDSSMSSEDEDILKCLVENGADIDGIEDSGLNLFLTCCSKRNHSYIVPYLTELGANPNIVANDGSTAMHFAAKNNDGSLISNLISCNFDMTLTDIVGPDGHTPGYHFITTTPYVLMSHFVSAAGSLSEVVQPIEKVLDMDINKLPDVEELHKSDLTRPQQMLTVLRHKALNVKSLQEICKLVIKKQIGPIRNIDQEDYKFKKLPIPPTLIDYIHPKYTDAYIKSFLENP